jgi:hypothetical protein
MGLDYIDRYNINQYQIRTKPVSGACRLAHNVADCDAVVRMFLQILSALGIIVGLLAAVAAVMYAFCWTVLLLVRFVPVIGRRHRHPRWDELTKRSGRGS